jgi:hypothetical protein
MKRKNSPHSVLSLPPTREAVDPRERGAVGRRSFVKKMGIGGALLAPLLALLVTSSAMAQQVFSGGIGVIPVIGSSGTPAANAIAPLFGPSGIQPPGDPWTISSLTAMVNANGQIQVTGRGLLLAGGDGIGTNGGQKVFVSLVCGTTVSSTPPAHAVALAANGDFTIDDFLSPVPSMSCANPRLLIRSATLPGGPWFAAGIPAH